MYPCCNADQGCTNLVAHPYDECETCFEEACAEDDEMTVMESWVQRGTTYHNLCMHGHDYRDCPRCNPYEAM